MDETDTPTFWREYRFLIWMGLSFSIGGIVYARMYFPDFSWFETVVGGIFFGCFCVMCAAGHRLFE